MNTRAIMFSSLCTVTLLCACASDDVPEKPEVSPSTRVVGGPSSGWGGPGKGSTGNASTTGDPAPAAVGGIAAAGSSAGTTPGSSTAAVNPAVTGGSAGAPVNPGMKGLAGTGATAGPGSTSVPPQVNGAPPPLTGDPNGSGPKVTIPDAACGPAPGLDAFVAGTGIPGPGSPNIKIGGRDVVLSYPCNLSEGAHVTFILNLHGTMPEETLKTYQHGYFSAHKLVTSHKLIVVTPISKSPVGQWGNMDGGVDVPHLYEVVNWVYDKFGTKFMITGMWIGGHSWGSMFAKQFVCDAMFKDKVRGIIGMSGGPTGVAGCASYISQIHTVGELEGGEAGVPDQSVDAMAHGCGARLAPKDIGNKQMLYEWPNCKRGWVHFNFVMGGHEHITAMDDPVVLHIVNAIKSTEM